MNFDQAFTKLVAHEGGYVDNAWDPGLQTKYGITRRSYPDEDIHELTLERARHIYLRDFWTPLRAEELPPDIRFQVFDFAVHSGVKTAVRALQRASGAVVDGIMGPLTIQAVMAMPPGQLNARFNGARLMLLADLKTWPAFGRGWVKRVAANLLEA